MTEEWDNQRIDVVSRDEWGALPPKSTEPMHHPAIKAILTYDLKIDICKTKEECIQAMKELQRRHVEEENSEDIKYNFLIGGDGRVYEGRGWMNKPCRSLKYSAYYNKRFDVGFIGNYVGTEDIPENIFKVAFLLFEIGIVSKYLIRQYDLYETRDPPKFLYKFDPDSVPDVPDEPDEITPEDFYRI